ncbi:methanethiol S-methyltransferase [Agriterribacter sp.]|uniref:methanethiol S-methyltransferase n=1 Tax=Agriterribacter sp. TaxID=2821509 RepID=UPI002C2F846F|nr:methanethiol S-methyltransferase [Agriterribacter sp.]HRP57132.1 hypothetical protein [Agriterribacter sp.]
MKVIYFIYGVLCYVVFLGVFLYAIGFVGNIYVPKSIDVGGDSSVMEAFIVNSILLTLFAVQHAVMARPAFKRWWTGIIPQSIERSTYVLATNFVMILLFWQWQPMTGVVWNTENGTLITVLWGLFALGWMVVFLSTFMINHFDLFGLKQVYESLRQKASQPLSFTKRYFYAVIRHPLMLGFIIAFWATPVMTIGHLYFSIMTTAYILISVKFLEERDLAKQLGEPYKRYQKEVPMLIPFTKSRRR